MPAASKAVPACCASQLSYVGGKLGAARGALAGAAPDLAHLAVELGAWCAQEAADRRVALATPQKARVQVRCFCFLSPQKM